MDHEDELEVRVMMVRADNSGWEEEIPDEVAVDSYDDEQEEALVKAGVDQSDHINDWGPEEDARAEAELDAEPAVENDEAFGMGGQVGPMVKEDWGDEEISPRNQIQVFDYYNGIHPHLARMAQISFFLPRLEASERETRRLQTALETCRRVSRKTFLYNRALETTFRHCDDFARAEWRSYTEVGDEVPETLRQWTKSLHQTPNWAEAADADNETFRDVICRMQETIDRLESLVEYAREGEDRALHGYAMERGRRLQAETERDAAVENQMDCRCGGAVYPQSDGSGSDTL